MFFKFESIDYAFIIFWLVLLDFYPGDIASRSCGATIRLVYDLHHIARSVLHQIGEEHRIARHDQEASTSRGPSVHPLDLQCHPLKFVCSPFEVEGEEELIGEVVVHLSRHCHHYHPLPYLHPIVPYV